jgi:endoglucanase
VKSRELNLIETGISGAQRINRKNYFKETSMPFAPLRFQKAAHRSLISTEVDKAAADPVADANVAYTFHFYACSHPGSLRERVRAAAGSIPIFFTEWGTSESSGGGNMCADSAQKWLDLADELGISWANWSLFNKNETSAALMPSAGPWGGWTDDQLSASGKWVKSKIREAADLRDKKLK